MSLFLFLLPFVFYFIKLLPEDTFCVFLWYELSRCRIDVRQVATGRLRIYSADSLTSAFSDPRGAFVCDSGLCEYRFWVAAFWSKNATGTEFNEVCQFSLSREPATLSKVRFFDLAQCTIENVSWPISNDAVFAFPPAHESSPQNLLLLLHHSVGPATHNEWSSPPVASSVLVG